MAFIDRYATEEDLAKLPALLIGFGPKPTPRPAADDDAPDPSEQEERGE